MCVLLGTNWVFISQKTTFFIITTVKTSNLTKTKFDSVRSLSLLLDSYHKRYANSASYDVIPEDCYTIKLQCFRISVLSKLEIIGWILSSNIAWRNTAKIWNLREICGPVYVLTETKSCNIKDGLWWHSRGSRYVFIGVIPMMANIWVLLCPSLCRSCIQLLSVTALTWSSPLQWVGSLWLLNIFHIYSCRIMPAHWLNWRIQPFWKS
jgi:hypothetical protein